MKVIRDVAWARRNDLLLFVLLAITALPIVMFRFFPSTDGPVHLNVAAILGLERDATGHRLHEVFRVRHGVSPYQTIYVVLGALMRHTSPEKAEAVVLLGYLVGGALAFRFAAVGVHPRGRELACIAVPMLMNFPLYMGFYNFSLAVIVWLVLIGIWLRARGMFSLPQAVAFTLTLVAAFFTHPTALVAGAAVLLPAHLVELRARLRTKASRASVLLRMIALPIVSAVPVVGCALRFGSRFRPAWALGWRSPLDVLQRVVSFDALVALDVRERLVALVLAATLFGAAAIALRNANANARASPPTGSPSNLSGWVAVAGAFALALAAPDRWTTDAFLMGSRFALMAALMLAVMVAGALESPLLRRALLGVSTLATVTFTLVRWPAHARFDREVREVETVMTASRPGDVLIPILYAKSGRDDAFTNERSLRTTPLLHAASRFAASRRVVAIHNPVACTSFSPLTFAAPDMNAVMWLQREIEAWERDVPTFDLEEAEARVALRFDLALVWGEARPDTTSREAIAHRNEDLAAHWRVVSHDGSATLYRRLPRMPRPPPSLPSLAPPPTDK